MKPNVGEVNRLRREFFKEVGKFFSTRFGTLEDESFVVRRGESHEACADQARPLVARINVTNCLAWTGASCQLCYLACPLREEAIVMRDLKPVIDSFFCDGCAMCVEACRTVNDLCAVDLVERISRNDGREEVLT